MKIEIHVHHHEADDGVLKQIIHLLKELIMTTEEAVAKVDALNAQVQKVQTEVQAVKDALAAAQSDGQKIPIELETAINSLGTSIQTVDDLNADAPEG